MNTLIVLTALSSWGYEGFCSEPAETVASAPIAEAPDRPHRPVQPAAPVTPAVPPPAVTPSAAVRPSMTPVAPTPRRAAPTPPPPPPTLWRLADANGQVWEHTDAEWLRRWVDSRDQSLRAAYRPFAAANPPAPYCTGNRCYRTR